MVDRDRRGRPSAAWVLGAILALGLLGAAFITWGTNDSDKGQSTTQRDSPKATPADRPRDQTDNTNP